MPTFELRLYTKSGASDLEERYEGKGSADAILEFCAAVEEKYYNSKLDDREEKILKIREEQHQLEQKRNFMLEELAEAAKDPNSPEVQNFLVETYLV